MENMDSNKQFIKFGAVLVILSLAWMVLSAFLLPKTTLVQLTAPGVGFQAPAFKLSALDGTQVVFNGDPGHPVVLNLWASWCRPCKAEMPALQRVYQEYASQGLIVYGINASNQDSLQEVESFIIDSKITFPILLDQDGAVSKLYALRALPTTYFISADGVIRQVSVGGPLSEAFLRSQISDLFRLVK
jgi:cytochrome c biogenesis protein CcmG/thiol:disulfide interchange protein DsbE